LKRPTGFIILSLIFGWLALAGIGNGIIIFNKPHGFLPASIVFLYGITALGSAIGLWKFRPWAYYATISWSITVLVVMFNMQFGMYGIYTLPLHLFALAAIFAITLLLLLLFYVKKKVRDI